MIYVKSMYHLQQQLFHLFNESVGLGGGEGCWTEPSPTIWDVPAGVEEPRRRHCGIAGVVLYRR
jgi:hypothetical protein